jgi:pimeloyl-ACP methyl ester carboxylesterase
VTTRLLLRATVAHGLALLIAVAPIGVRAAEIRTADVFGERIAYVDTGTGPPVVLVHGLADDLSVWHDTVAAIAKHHRVIALDLLGFGRSAKPLVEYRAATEADVVDGLLARLHVTHATVVGNSLGGWVAALLAVRRPARVARLVLVDAAGLRGLGARLGPRNLADLRLADRDAFVRLCPQTFFDARFCRDDPDGSAAFAARLHAADGYAVGRIVDAIARGDDALDPVLSAVRVPTLVIWGRGDRLIPLADGIRFRAAIRGARLTVLERCGHEPQVECAARFNDVLRGFLGDRPRPRT